jgi:hypothetical protein
VFRWHDSGDVQDVDHLEKIFEVCRLTPSKRHWMPTREAWIKDHMQDAPANLVVRFHHRWWTRDQSRAGPILQQSRQNLEAVQPLTTTTSAAAVELAGTRLLKILNMVNTSMTHVFKHPKFYRIPRDKSDQAISLRAHDGEASVRRIRAKASSLKLQAASVKLQAPRASSLKRQASSPKHKGSSVKPQASSSMICDPGYM